MLSIFKVFGDLFHCFWFLGALNYILECTRYNVSHVSLIMRLTVFFRIRKICESPDARKRNVSINLCAGRIAFRKFVSFFTIKRATSDKRCFIRSGGILKKLKNGYIIRYFIEGKWSCDKNNSEHRKNLPEI